MRFTILSSSDFYKEFSSSTVSSKGLTFSSETTIFYEPTSVITDSVQINSSNGNLGLIIVPSDKIYS